MRTEIKERWLEALRSGRYEQGKGGLEKDGQFCCLGVLCDLAVTEGVVTRDGADPDGFISYRDGEELETTFLPKVVQNWAGVPGLDPIVRVPCDHQEPCDSGRHTESLADLNDNRMSFPEIADVIEEQL